MGNANVVAMVARPVRGALLCFEVGGILDELTVDLGSTIQPIPFRKLVDKVQGLGATAGDLSRLRGGAEAVLKTISPHLLASLRNADRKAALESAINSRQNIYFSKYENANYVIATIRGYYSYASPASNPHLLERLSALANQQLEQLGDAYQTDDRTGVVRSTSSDIKSRTQGGGESHRASKFYQESVGIPAGPNSNLPHRPPVPWEGYPDHQWTAGYESRRTVVHNGTGTAVTTGVTYEEANNASHSSGWQCATHTDYEYRTPYIEAQARSLRAQISLNNQQFESYMFGQNIPHLEKVFANELASIDNDIHQLQLALLRSCLFSPTDGVVTGIYKSPGEFVAAGEPVIRVEDNSVVHLVATLVYPGPIATGTAATVATTLGGAGSPARPIDGTVVAARGQDSGARWEVLIRVDNRDAAGHEILPLGYVFDPEYTTLSFA